MILPNQTEIKNSRYTVPSCKDCNAEPGELFEKPLSKLFQKDHSDICKELKNDESLYFKIYHWAALIFFKTHLKDTLLLKDRDKRKSSGAIADHFCWHGLFGVHNFIRLILSQHMKKSLFLSLTLLATFSTSCIARKVMISQLLIALFKYDALTFL